MNFTHETTAGGVQERLFELEVGGQRVPGSIWSPVDAPRGRPIVLMGHGGGQHKRFPGIAMRAHKYASALRFLVVAIDAPGHGDRVPSKQDQEFVEELRRLATQGEPFGQVVAEHNAELARIAVPEWQSALDAVQTLEMTGDDVPVGYLGVSMGGAIGVPLVATEPRIKAAVIGLIGLVPSGQDLVDAANRVEVPVEFVLQLEDELVPRKAAMVLFDAIGSHEKTLHANRGGHTAIPAFEHESWERFFGRHLQRAGNQSG